MQRRVGRTVIENFVGKAIIAKGDGEMTNLFVCLGNICRSPMAEGLLRKRIALEGREAEFCGFCCYKHV